MIIYVVLLRGMYGTDQGRFSTRPSTTQIFKTEFKGGKKKKFCYNLPIRTETQTQLRRVLSRGYLIKVANETYDITRHICEQDRATLQQPDSEQPCTKSDGP